MAALVGGTLAAAGLGGPAAAKVVRPSSGPYNCTMSFMVPLGRIGIDGDEIQPYHDWQTPGDPHPFEMTEKGELVWRGRLRLFPNKDIFAVSGRLVDPSGGPFGITFIVKNEKGRLYSVHCSGI